MATHAASQFSAGALLDAPAPAMPRSFTGDAFGGALFDFPAPDIPQTFPVRLFPSDSPTVVSGLTYRMRGFDQHVSVNDYVYWSATEVDSDASEYGGSIGPVVDVVLWVSHA